MTPGGQQAEDLSNWAWEDPASRLAEAQSQVAELYAAAADPREKAEIGGVATMLSRLAGSLVQNRPSILDQLGESS